MYMVIVGAYPQANNDAPSTSPSSTVVSMEVPPPALMDNESEGESSLAPITLMYAQQTLPFFEGMREDSEESKEKNLRELLEEQDIGEQRPSQCQIDSIFCNTQLISTYPPTHTHTHTHTRARTHTHTHMHTHTHTHTHTHRSHPWLVEHH